MDTGIFHTILRSLVFGVLFSILGLSACTWLPIRQAETVEPGNAVVVRYTCTLPDGRIVSTTEKSAAAALDETEKRFLFERDTKDQHKPIRLTAGNPPSRKALSDAAPGTENIPSLQLKGLHEELDEQLAQAVVGQPMNQWVDLTLTAVPQSDVQEPERRITLSRVIKAPKTMRVARASYESRTGSPVPPEIGQGVGMYPGIAGEVVDMSADQVTIDFTQASTEPLQTMFGERRVLDRGDHFLVRTEVEKGKLIRTGPHLGRVTDIQRGQFIVDYGHAFGGQPLSCRVNIMPATAADSPGKTVASKDGQAGTETGQANAKMIEHGDLVRVHYTARLMDGRLVYTTRKTIANDGNVDRVDWYQDPPAFAPELVTAGTDNPPPGLGKVVLAMADGETKTVKLPAADAFGLANPTLVKQYDRTKTRPRTETIDMKTWSARFDAFPVKGRTYAADGFLKARVTRVADKAVAVEYFPRADTFDRPVGTVTAEVNEDTIDLVLAPEIGSPYTIEGKKGPVTGTVASVDDKTFTVDFNHPLAGKDIRLSIEVVDVTGAENLENIEMQWVEDHDAGLEQAKQENKPMVLVLYAGWCSYSKKLLDETLPAPRIKLLRDDFVWVKVDSAEDPYLKELYGQTGFPLTVVVSPEGDVIKKINGFKPAAAMYTELHAAAAGQLSG
ncbi:MAG: thioredoxin family protein [Thermodesulfobacteriota bacterium]|nr:thioredoxin family protein [Thermodesulfobacteriota bacterium]